MSKITVFLLPDDIVYLIEQLLLAVDPFQQLSSLLPEHPHLAFRPVFCPVKCKILPDLLTGKAGLCKNADHPQIPDFCLTEVCRAVSQPCPGDQPFGFILPQLLSRNTESFSYLLNRHVFFPSLPFPAIQFCFPVSFSYICG